MTGWDFLHYLIEKGFSWPGVVLILIGIIIWIITHPEKVVAWNVQIETWIAGIVPKKRKRAFEKRLNLTIETARTRFESAMPLYMQRFLPYDLKVTWVSEEETMDSILEDQQVIVYVPSYKDEAKQAVGVLYNYCSNGFVRNAKIYMPGDAVTASDLIMTEKLAQYAGRKVYDYFIRQYLPEKMGKDKTYRAVLNKLRQIDRDGLFLPVLINEIDKYVNKISPSPPSEEIVMTIIHLMEFVLKIATHDQGERVPLTFNENGIKIRVFLAVSDSQVSEIDSLIERIEQGVLNRSVDTIYILATGTKIGFAHEIATKVYERNPQDIFDPVTTQYKRYTKSAIGTDAVCYEINVR